MAKAKSPNGSKRKDENRISPAAPPEVAEKAGLTRPRKTNGSREGARLAVAKTDARATVIPVDLEDEIRRRAYELSERRGFTSGHEAEDWLAAESEVLQRYRQHSA